VFCIVQVLCCLALLVNVLGADSPATYPLLLPLLREALHPDSTQPELLEDGLGLWLVAVRNAPSPDAGAPLLELTPALTACLTNSTGQHLWGTMSAPWCQPCMFVFCQKYSVCFILGSFMCAVAARITSSQATKSVQVL